MSSIENWTKRDDVNAAILCWRTITAETVIMLRAIDRTQGSFRRQAPFYSVNVIVKFLT
jgi:hypothetical protein